jgi:hypothetical protein
MDERWEAIEDAERRFRDTRLRVSTDNIGMARLPDGTDLVRVGPALRPEFAAWRYGDQFGRRRRRAVAAGAVGAAAVAAAAPVTLPAAAAAFWTGGGIFVSGWMAGGAQLPYQAAKQWLLSERVLARVPLGDGGPAATVRVRHLRESALLGGDGVTLRLAHEGGAAHLAGEHARRALGVLPRAQQRVGRGRARRARGRSAASTSSATRPGGSAPRRGCPRARAGG